MREKMHVHASVDEADIGLIQTAQEERLPVTFTVDAYPDLFTGNIEEIRLSSTTTQNVVTYPVVVAAPNPDLKLLPGMTANISFEVDRRTNVLKIPNSALRFFPQPQHVRNEDKPLLEGQGEGERQPTRATCRRRAFRPRSGPKLAAIASCATSGSWMASSCEAVEVIVGLSESRFTELVSGDLKVGDKLVTGIEPPKTWGG